MSDGGAVGIGNDVEAIRVLVVEDNDDNRALLELALTCRGFTCRSAANPIEAMRIIGELEPDVIISDISMPEEDGLSFIRRVRNLPGRVARVPAVAVTALGTKADRALSLESGFDRHLLKPVNIRELEGLIVDLVREAAAKAARSDGASDSFRSTG